MRKKNSILSPNSGDQGNRLKSKKKGGSFSCFMVVICVLPAAIFVFSIGIFMGNEFSNNDHSRIMGIGGPLSMINNRLDTHKSPGNNDAISQPKTEDAGIGGALKQDKKVNEIESKLQKLQKELEILRNQKEEKEKALAVEQEKNEKMAKDYEEQKQHQHNFAEMQNFQDRKDSKDKLEEKEISIPGEAVLEEDRKQKWSAFNIQPQSYAKLSSPMEYSQMTVCAWIFLNSNDAPKMKTIVSNKNSGCQKGAYGYALYINDWESNNGQLILEWGDDTTGCNKVKSEVVSLRIGRWYHVSFSLSSSNAFIYIDGKKVGESSAVSRSFSENNLIIGEWPSGDYNFEGKIASVIFWDVVLTAGQVQIFMKATAENKVEDHPDPKPRSFFSLQQPDEEKPNNKLVDIMGDVKATYVLPPVFGDSSGVPKREITEADRKESDEQGRQRAEAIKEGFRHAWKGYKEHAWGADEVKPQSGRASNNWGGIACTMVDALDTLWLMGMKTEFWEARDYIRDQLSFEHAGSVSMFETTIRELGGLLSAHSLSGDDVFLKKAEDLGKRLARAFETRSGMPNSQVDLRDGRSSLPGWTGGNAILSEVGTLQVEFQYLSKHTGNPEYGRKAMRVFEILKDKPTTDGLAPIYVDVNSGNFAGSKITFGALGDSYYEYLLKAWLQNGKRDTYLREMYDRAVQGMHNKLVQHTTPSGFTYLADLEGGRLEHKMDHLACFMSATLVLGAHTDPQGIESARAKRDMKVAKELAHTCYQLYHRQKTHLSPEYVNFRPNSDFVLPEQASFYILRPEAVEALFYMFFFTKDPIYRDWSWEIYEAINKHCRTNIAYGAHPDVRSPDRQPDDRMESFFLAETFKYMYLIQDPDQPIDLYKYVFNTEAHPTQIFD